MKTLNIQVQSEDTTDLIEALEFIIDGLRLGKPRASVLNDELRFSYTLLEEPEEY